MPHTHWDREWYRPFQGFRMRLVDVVDRVLETLDADPELRFTLDGQVAIVDDYLEIRPVQLRRGTDATGRVPFRDAAGPRQNP